MIETITLTSAIRGLIMDKASEYKILEIARKEGTRTLREAGVMKALAGSTSLEEVARLTIADKDEPTKSDKEG